MIDGVQQMNRTASFLRKRRHNACTATWAWALSLILHALVRSQRRLNWSSCLLESINLVNGCRIV